MALNFEPRDGPACDDRAMTDQRPYRLGSGPLTAARVGRDALAMLRQSFVRIAAAAVIFFALPALVAALTVDVITQFVGEQDALLVIAAVVGLLIAATVRILGPVAFAGFLDQAVAKEYLHGHHSTLVDVMRRLPWRRLIAVDLHRDVRRWPWTVAADRAGTRALRPVRHGWASHRARRCGRP